MAKDAAFSIDPDELLRAYRLGYFPMARTAADADVVWVLPKFRGVLELADARIPRRLVRDLRRSEFSITVNEDFLAVMKACAAAAPDRPDTWINDAIIEVYCELHFRGLAHSVECRDARGALVGGLYGVAIGGVFCGESMFSRRTNASKFALIHLLAMLIKGGFELLDTQFYTDHLAQFGVDEIANEAYLARLGDLSRKPAQLAPAMDHSSAIAVLQSMTQTS